MPSREFPNHRALTGRTCGVGRGSRAAPQPGRRGPPLDDLSTALDRLRDRRTPFSTGMKSGVLIKGSAAKELAGMHSLPSSSANSRWPAPFSMRGQTASYTKCWTASSSPDSADGASPPQAPPGRSRRRAEHQGRDRVVGGPSLTLGGRLRSLLRLRRETSFCGHRAGVRVMSGASPRFPTVTCSRVSRHTSTLCQHQGRHQTDRQACRASWARSHDDRPPRPGGTSTLSRPEHPTGARVTGPAAEIPVGPQFSRLPREDSSQNARTTDVPSASESWSRFPCSTGDPSTISTKRST